MLYRCSVCFSIKTALFGAIEVSALLQLNRYETAFGFLILVACLCDVVLRFKTFLGEILCLVVLY